MESKTTVSDMMCAYAEDAVDAARVGFGIELDYSEVSVESVEEILHQFHRSIPKGFLTRLFKPKPSTDQIDGICKMFGGYIGEVFRRSHGGDWEFNKDVSPGSLVITLRLGDFQIFPPAKVYKRLTNGPEDNVWS